VTRSGGVRLLQRLATACRSSDRSWWITDKPEGIVREAEKRWQNGVVYRQSLFDCPETGLWDTSYSMVTKSSPLRQIINF
jgi:hypothetical protein